MAKKLGELFVKLEQPLVLRRVWAMLLAFVVVSALALQLTAPQAAADTAPANPADPRTPETVALDALPTVQVDGVVWAQTVVGTTVYAVGSFTTARPAGAAPGVNTVVRSNALAYDLVTGELKPNWAPELNAQGMAVAASPDGSRIYIGGDFTRVNGQIRNRIVALNPTTGALVSSFQPKPNARVRALAVTNDKVYFGGSLTTVGTVARNRAAAAQASDGALLGWAPNVQGGTVWAMALAPDQSKVVLGGNFGSVNGSTQPGTGLAMIDPDTGTVMLPFQANTIVTNTGSGSAINSLTASPEGVYGTGYGFQQGPTRLEGAFRAKWNGDLDWLQDCHGDSYSAVPHAGAVYVVSHAHHCQNVGGFPQTNPPYRAMAFSRTAPNVVSTNTQSGYKDYAGQPAPSILQWFPTLTTGTASGQDQGAWSLAAAGDYLVMGGEFPTVNNRPQQGLARFATKQIAANSFGPAISDTSIDPTATVAPDGAVRVSWTANWDRDNKSLRYDLVRNGDVANPVESVTADSVPWQRPRLTAVDRSVAPNTSYTYQVIAYDAFDNDQESETTSITTGSSTPPNFAGPYGPMVAGDGPSNFWRLGENSGSTTADWIGANPGSVKGGVTLGAAGTLLDDPNKAATFDGASNGYISTGPLRSGMNTFTVESWFKTTTNQGGKIVGFGGATTGNSLSTAIDRHIYMLNDGRLTFGTYFSNAQRVVTSSDSYNDGDWHQVAGTVGPNGMELYVDGAIDASRLDAKGGRAYSGNWRIGGDYLSGWPNRPTSDYFAGTIDEVSVYPNALSAARILAHYNAATQPPQNDLPNAAFTFDSVRGDATFDGSGSTDPDGTISSYEWDFGDGASGTGVTPTHTYAADGNYDVTLTVTDNRGATDSVTHTVSIVIPSNDVLATDAFNRTITNGWGTADFGGLWTLYGGPSLFKVSNGVGTMTMSSAGTGPRARLNSVSSSDVDLKASVVLDKPATGGGTFISATTRANGTDEYRTKVKIASNGQATVYLTKIVAGSETTLVSANVPLATLTYAAGSKLWIRAQAVGTNSPALAAKVWLDSASEPGAWQVSISDNTPSASLQSAGSVGLVSYLASSATNAPMQASFDDLSVKKTQP